MRLLRLGLPALIAVSLSTACDNDQDKKNSSPSPQQENKDPQQPADFPGLPEDERLDEESADCPALAQPIKINDPLAVTYTTPVILKNAVFDVTPNLDQEGAFTAEAGPLTVHLFNIVYGERKTEFFGASIKPSDIGFVGSYAGNFHVQGKSYDQNGVVTYETTEQYSHDAKGTAITKVTAKVQSGTLLSLWMKFPLYTEKTEVTGTGIPYTMRIFTGEHQALCLRKAE